MTSPIHKAIPASHGISFGKLFIIERQFGSIVKHETSHADVSDEIERFRDALYETKEELQSIKKVALEETGLEHIYVLDTHLMILEDRMLVDETIKILREQHCNAEWALKLAIDKLSNMFRKMEVDYFKLRKNDIEQVAGKILKHLAGHELDLFEGLEEGMIIVAHDLSPAETIRIKNRKVGGFITEVGGKTSHTSIFAISLGVPAVVGCKGILEVVEPGDQALLDGSDGIVIIEPSPRQFDYYLRKQQREKYKIEQLQKHSVKEAVTLDGVSIHLYANIESVDEHSQTIMKKFGAEGVGLFRTEGIYVGAKTLPDEEVHYQTYKKLSELMEGRPVTIRTLDVGGDKLCDLISLPSERNPAMGLRAIRYSFYNHDLFRHQLRGILRASAHGELRIMFPMISHLGEVYQAKKVIAELQQELKREGVKFDEKIKTGVMIETPAAALIADALAKEVDFFSIGTNDLIQYVMAADRCNESVSDLYQPLHPGVLRLIKETIDAANRHNIEVSICGEMGATPLYVALFLGMGELSSISTEAVNIPLVKETILGLDSSLCKRVAEKVLSLDCHDTIDAYLKEHIELKQDEL